ncbi:hypothetical protein Tco_1226871 [Tanacetum coccineum]
MPTEMELTLEQTQQGVSYEVSVLSDIEDSHGPSDAKHKPLPATQSQKDFVSKKLRMNTSFPIDSLLRVSDMKRFNTSAGNPVKKILLKLNLSDHRLFKMVVEITSILQMLPDITYYCWVTTVGSVNAVRLNLVLLVQVNAQFWATAKVKTVNGEVQIQALVDKKKVIITETSVRSDLQLKDAEGTECLPNAAIFEQLTLMGYENLTQKLTFYKAFFSPQWKFLIHTILQCLSAKTTTWNEFSSTMASAVICLATNQKFNFSKYIFDNMVKNLEGGVKFLMYPRFVQVFMDKQVEEISKHKKIYVTPSHTKKVFVNMKRQGKYFSSRDTPLFPTMIVQAQEQVGEGSEIPTDSHHTPTTTQPSTSKPQKKQSRRKQRKDTKDPQLSGPTEPVTDDTENVASVPTHSNDLLLSGEDRLKLNELMELCTSLSQRVLDLEKTKTSQAAEITELKKRVKKLEGKRKSKPPGMKRLFKIGRSAQVVSSKDEGLGDQEDASKEGRKIVEIHQDVEVTLVDETQGRYDDNLMFDTGVLDMASPIVTIPAATLDFEVVKDGTRSQGASPVVKNRPYTVYPIQKCLRCRTHIKNFQEKDLFDQVTQPWGAHVLFVKKKDAQSEASKDLKAPAEWLRGLLEKVSLLDQKLCKKRTEKIVQIKEILKTQDGRREKLWLIKGVYRLNSRLETECYLRYLHGRSGYDLKLCPPTRFMCRNLKKNAWHEPDVQVPFVNDIEINENLRFVKEPIDIVEL